MFIAVFIFPSLQHIPIVPPTGGGIEILLLIGIIIIGEGTAGMVVGITITVSQKTHIFICPTLFFSSVRNFLSLVSRRLCQMGN